MELRFLVGPGREGVLVLNMPPTPSSPLIETLENITDEGNETSDEFLVSCLLFLILKLQEFYNMYI